MQRKCQRLIYKLVYIVSAREVECIVIGYLHYWASQKEREGETKEREGDNNCNAQFPQTS